MNLGDAPSEIAVWRELDPGSMVLAVRQADVRDGG